MYNNDLSGCYPQQLVGLCNSSLLTLDDAKISDGNSGLTSWEHYCNLKTNVCCPPILDLNWEPVHDGIYKSQGDIMLPTDLAPNSNITLSTGNNNSVTIPNGSTATISSSVIITQDGCN